MKIKTMILKKLNKNQAISLTPNFIKNGTDFKGRTALIIGGGSGIGRAIADELLNNGARVIVCGRKKYDIDKMDVETLDISRIEEIKSKLQEIVNKYSPIDILVNSQGICPDIDFKQQFYSVDKDDFEEVFRLNLESVFFTNQFFCEYYLQKNIKGNILNICSTEGLKGNIVPYGLSKAAVISLTKGIGKMMAPENIIVNGIAPGATATGMMKMDENQSIRINYIPSKRANVPIEVAKVAHLLLSDAGRQMCGQVVTIDGGESL